MADNLVQFLDDFGKELSKRTYVPRPFSDLDNYPLAKGQTIYLLDYQTKKIAYQKGLNDFFGLETEDYNFEQLLSNYHPADADIVMRLVKATLLFAADNDVSHSLGFFLTYRVRHQNGTYIKVLRQSNVFDKDEKGQIISNTSLLTNIDFLDSSNCVQWKFDAPGLDQQKFKEYVSKAYSDFFTERETQIIRFLKKGNSSLEIATALNLSKHTVDTHRRKILKKSNCKNAIELLFFCNQNGLV